MLHPFVVAEVERYLDLGLHHRKIAALTGAGRATVGCIARGERAPQTSLSDEAGEIPPDLSARCPGCGFKQTEPCRVCAARAEAKKRRVVRTLDIDDADVRIQLRGEAWFRYLELHRQKVEANQRGELTSPADGEPDASERGPNNGDADSGLTDEDEAADAFVEREDLAAG